MATIVDKQRQADFSVCLYGSLNFYYCRLYRRPRRAAPRLYGSLNFYYCRFRVCGVSLCFVYMAL